MSYMMNESTEWSEWSACSLLVVHSGQRITIYSETTQTYDILWSTEEYTDSSGFQTMDFRAVNEEGKTVDCNLTHVIRKDPVSEELHLYLRLPTFTIAYALAEIE